MGQNFISVLGDADFIEVFNNFVLSNSNFVDQNITAILRRAKQETKI